MHLGSHGATHKEAMPYIFHQMVTRFPESLVVSLGEQKVQGVMCSSRFSGQAQSACSYVSGSASTELASGL